MQEVAFTHPANSVKKIWSDANLGDDFDMALRLHLQNHIVGSVTCSEGGSE